MAVYKVIQDIESEDKLIGPLTLKGFIYAAIAALLAFINIRLLISPSLGFIKWPFILVFLPPMLLFGILASPLGREQPTEVWLLSRIRFFFKPRRRIWNQSGMNHPVTVTAPKKIERQLTKDLDQKEVNSRLKALASTLDSRGWTVKNSAVNLNDSLEAEHDKTDRLIKPATLSPKPPAADVHPADDILDEQHNPTAKKFDAMIKKADEHRRKSLFDQLKNLVVEEDNHPEKVAKKDAQRIVSLHQQQVSSQPAARKAVPPEPVKKFAEPAHKKTVHKSAKAIPKKHTPAPVTAASRAVKLELAQSGNDLSVASIAHLANRPPRVRRIGPNEVEISLH
jgi:hypothetical protein